MTRFILGRVIQALVSLLVMSIIIFYLSRLTGDPAFILLPDEQTGADREALMAEFNLDKPVHVQYGIWLWNALQGDLGMSPDRREPVTSLILQRIPSTLQLAAAGFVVTLLIGIPLGIYSAAWRGSPLDWAARGSAVLGQAIPGFWLGLILILVFAVWLGVLPAGGKEGFSSVILPGFTMGWVTTAGIMRLTRSAMLEVLDAEYIKLARVKGATESAVLWKHALKNAALPVLTFASLILLIFVGGAIITETVFAWPGIGRLTMDAVLHRDFPVLQGAILFISAAYLIGSLIVDIAYSFIDPRIRHG